METRDKKIDMIRGFGALLVIIGHTGASAFVKKLIYGFHMPLFFILSGYLFNWEKWQERGLRAFTKARFHAYVVPYFVLAVINLFINIPLEFINGLKGKELLFSTCKHALWIFYSSGRTGDSPNCGPLWFLSCIFISEIFLFALMKLSSDKRFTACVALWVIDLIFANALDFQMPWHMETALIGAVFMVVGYDIRQYGLVHDTRINKYVIMPLGMIALYIIVKQDKVNLNINELRNSFMTFSGAALMSFIVLWIFYKVPKCEWLAFLGRNTLIVMGFNLALNSWFVILWNCLSISKIYSSYWWIESIANVIGCLCIAYIWNGIKAKRNWLGR